MITTKYYFILTAINLVNQHSKQSSNWWFYCEINISSDYNITTQQISLLPFMSLTQFFNNNVNDGSFNFKVFFKYMKIRTNCSLYFRIE